MTAVARDRMHCTVPCVRRVRDRLRLHISPSVYPSRGPIHGVAGPVTDPGHDRPVVGGLLHLGPVLETALAGARPGPRDAGDCKDARAAARPGQLLGLAAHKAWKFAPG